jgi:hypothetical protein
MPSEPITITLLVVEVLDDLNVPYAIGGSLASSWHGVSRATFDSDIVAALELPHVRPFIDRLHHAFYVDEGAMREAIDRRRSFNLIHLETMFKVDIFIAKNRRFDRMQMANRRLHAVADEPARSAYFASAEDTILAKLEWYRLGGEISDRQWQDVLGIVKAQGDRLDWAYLREQALGLSVADLLERLAGEQA